MAEGKIDLKTAKGAIAGAAAGAIGERNYKAEEALKDAIKAAKTAGAKQSEVEAIVGSAVLNTIDRYGCDDAEPSITSSMPAKPPAPRGLARTLSKIGSERHSGEIKSDKHFLAGFASGLSEELAKESQEATKLEEATA